MIRAELAAGTLRPLCEGGERYAQLYLVFADRDAAGAWPISRPALL
jgi:hypothetical protein